MTVEIQIGPLYFTKESGSGMSVHNEHETLGYCESVWDETWAAFVEAVRNGDVKELA